MFINNFLPLFLYFSPPPTPHLFSINRDICLKPASLNLHPIHLLKSQLVLEEVEDDVLKRCMSPSEGTRGENQGIAYTTELCCLGDCCGETGQWPHHFMIHHLASSLQFCFPPPPKIILIFVVIIVGDYFLWLQSRNLRISGLVVSWDFFSFLIVRIIAEETFFVLG